MKKIFICITLTIAFSYSVCSCASELEGPHLTPEQQATLSELWNDLQHAPEDKQADPQRCRCYKNHGDDFVLALDCPCECHNEDSEPSNSENDKVEASEPCTLGKCSHGDSLNEVINCECPCHEPLQEKFLRNSTHKD